MKKAKRTITNIKGYLKLQERIQRAIVYKEDCSVNELFGKEFYQLALSEVTSSHRLIMH